MKKSKLFATAFVLTCIVAYGVASCGGGSLESLPSSGVICTSCAASGDCDIQCSAGEQSFCGHFGFFDDPGLRCAFCDTRDDPFAESRSPVEP